MKILELRDFGDAHRGSLPPLILTTDSSVVRDNKPVFLPEISERWRCDFMLAFTICRLGKAIAERFASRYYDKATVAVRFVPLDMAGKGDGSALLTPWATAFDGAMALGRPVNWTGAMNIVISSPCKAEIKCAAPPVDKAISLLSQDMIIKTGDMIIPPGLLASCDVAIGDRVEATVNGAPILKFNVK